MTREETKKRIKVMQAFVDGKDVEVLNTDKWELVSNPSWSPATKYRIKPESKYRPFESAQECIEEMMKHEPFGWVMSKPYVGDYCSPIIDIRYGSAFNFIKLRGSWKDTNLVFEHYTFLDGSPFGVKVEYNEDNHE